MANSKISALAAVTTVGDTDEYVAAVGGATKKITGANLKTGVRSTVRDGISYLGPTGSLGQTYDRRSGGNAELTITSGALYLYSVFIPAEQTITSISFFSGGTALISGTNQWFGLFSSARVPLRFTTDDTSTAWGTNAVKTLSLSSTYTTTTAGMYYLGVMVAAATPVKLRGSEQAGGAEIITLAPTSFGVSSTGLTTTASCPNPAGAISAGLICAYGYWS